MADNKGSGINPDSLNERERQAYDALLETWEPSEITEEMIQDLLAAM